MDTKKQLALAAGASLGLVALYRWQRRSKKAAPPPLEKRRLAPGLEVTVLGCGGASLGDLYVETTHEAALATLSASLDGGIQFYDTAPWYGCGLSEARFGLGLARADRASFSLNTKVGRTLEPDLGARTEQQVYFRNVGYRSIQVQRRAAPCGVAARSLLSADNTRVIRTGRRRPSPIPR